ncbi:MAG: hypothetical protein J0J15_02820, partial [Mesorhizobium sp.]|nr:hypothetical protein [Mesorhizobium sp.]
MRASAALLVGIDIGTTNLKVVAARPGGRVEAVVRRVVGISGEVDFVSEVRFRFDYARAVPWVRQIGDGHAHAILAVAGPDAVVLRGPRL